MPKMGGRQFLERMALIAETRPKVLIITSFTSEDPTSMKNILKVAGVLTKLYRLQDLIRKIINTLDMKKKSELYQSN